MTGFRVLWALASAAALAAQTGSGGGWSQQDSLRQAGAVVIGELTAGAAEDRTASVAAEAVLRIRRVIRGNVVPETELRLAWEYQPGPMETPQQTEQVPPLYGLWLLDGPGEGVWRPLPVAPYLPRMGGVCLELPRTEPVGDFFYPGDALPDVRLAHELAAALEAIAEAEGERLNPERRPLPGGGLSGRITPEQARFQQIAGMLALADRAAALPLYRRFSDSSHANLRVVGLAGRMRAGDIEAVLSLQRDAATLAPTLEAVNLAHSLDQLAFDRNLPALDALGRAALAETEIPNLEGAAAFRLGWARRWEAFPYLAVMLRSPNPYTRAQAIQGFCAALRPVPPPPPHFEGLWRAGMERYCPSPAPVQNPAVELAAVRFWTGWWQAQRKLLDGKVALAGVRPPARYGSGPAPQPQQQVEVPMEERFRALSSMTAAFLRDTPQPRRSPLAQSLPPADDEKLLAAAEKTTAELERQHRKTMALVNAARVRGEKPDRQEMVMAEEERQRVLRENLAELRRDLSPAAWDTVERWLKEMNITAVPVGQALSPTPPVR